MGEGQRGGWQWADVPVPEPHVAGLLVGEVIHSLVPVRATANQRLARALGWLLIGIGLLIIGWAVRTIGEPDGQHPGGLMTTEPYAFTRNPMYVGWSALFLGLALVLNIAWLFVAFPAVWQPAIGSSDGGTDPGTRIRRRVPCLSARGSSVSIAANLPYK